MDMCSALSILHNAESCSVLPASLETSDVAEVTVFCSSRAQCYTNSLTLNEIIFQISKLMPFNCEFSIWPAKQNHYMKCLKLGTWTLLGFLEVLSMLFMESNIWIISIVIQPHKNGLERRFVAQALPFASFVYLFYFFCKLCLLQSVALKWTVRTTSREELYVQFSAKHGAEPELSRSSTGTNHSFHCHLWKHRVHRTSGWKGSLEII